MFTMKIVLNDILLIWSVVQITAVQHTNTQAGYTKDSDTCKKYNENLQMMWSNLSKYINSTDSASDLALHNIAIIIQAYLDHQNNHKQEVVFQPDGTIEGRNDDNITRVLRNIKKLMESDDIEAYTKIDEMILVNFKPSYEGQDPDCKEKNERNLLRSISSTFVRYFSIYECNYEDDHGLIGLKAQLRNGTQPISMLQVQHEGIMYETEPTEQSDGDMIPAVIHFKSPDRFNQRTNTKRNFQKVFRHLTERSGHSMLSDKSKTAVNTNPQSRNKIYLRTEGPCIEPANRFLFHTLRAVIKRYNDLSDCVHDETLRTSNKTSKSTRSFQYSKPMLRIRDNNIQVMGSMRSGQPKQIRKRNYDNLEKFKRNKALKTIFVVRKPSYAGLLSQIRNSLGNLSPPLPYYSSQNNKQLTKFLFDYILGPGYNSENKHKSYLDSELRLTSQIANKIQKTQCAHNGNNIKDIKNEQVDVKPSFGTQEENSRESDTLEINTDGSEPLVTYYVKSKDLWQDTEGGDIHTVRKDLADFQKSSLPNTQVDVNNINDEKGHIELLYLVKYPKSILYPEQHLVKNILSYDDFIKVGSHVYLNDEDKQLVKILRFLPDNSTQVLFENREVYPLAIHDITDRMSDNKNEYQEHPELKLIEKDKTSSVTEFINSHPDSLREDKKKIVKQSSFQTNKNDAENLSDLKIGANVYVEDSLQKDKFETGFEQVDFNFQDDSNIQMYPASLIRKPKMSINLADSLSKDNVESHLKHKYIKLQNDIRKNTYYASPITNDQMTITYVSPIDNFKKDKIETDLQQSDLNQNDKINSGIYPESFIGRAKMTINAISADNVLVDEGETDLKKADFNLEDKMISDTYQAGLFRRNDISMNVNPVKSLQEDNVRIDELQANLTQFNKSDNDIDSVKNLREDEIINNLNPTDSLQVDKDKTYFDQTDSTVERNIETDLSINTDQANYLQKNINDSLAVLSISSKTDDDNHAEYLKDDKLMTNLDKVDSLIKDEVETDVKQVHSIEKDFHKFSTDLNQADTTYSWKNEKVEADLAGGDYTRKREKGHKEYLRQHSIIAHSNSTGSLQNRHEVKPNILQADSIRQDKFETVLDHQDPLKNYKGNDKVETYLDQTDSTRKDFDDSNTVHTKSLRDVEIITGKKKQTTSKNI